MKLWDSIITTLRIT